MLDFEIALAVELGIAVDAERGTLVQHHRVRHAAPYTCYRYERRHTASYGVAQAHTRRHRAAWWLVELVRARHAAAYDLADRNRHARRHRVPWSLLAGQALVPVANTPELAHAGRTHRIESADLSADEDSPVWIARITLADAGSHSAIAIGDAISLVLGVETFALVVDGKTASRDTVGDLRTEITAVSPLALKDAPWTQPVTLAATGATPARTLVEAQIGATTWALPDWIIPAGRAEFDGATPLKIARAVVESIGGVVESAPDGTPLCRPRHPVSVPAYATASPAHALADRDVLGVSANIAPRARFDRVIITNEGDGSGPSDRLEFLPDEGDDHRGTVRAWPEPWRPVTLAHTGHPGTVVADTGEVVREVAELVEFVEGQAQVDYPVVSIISAAWQHADLGAVTAGGKHLAAAVLGYSLLAVRYTTRAREWRVALDGADESVQFVLMGE